MVVPGQKLRIKAADYNRLLDILARERSASRWGADGMRTSSSSGDIRVRTQNVRDAFTVVRISGSFITPAANLDEFQRGPCMEADYAMKGEPFAILQAPASSYEVVPARVVGPTVARVDGELVAKQTVGPENNSPYLKADSEGTARVLYVESGTGPRWAIVLLGGGAGGSTMRVARYTGTRNGVLYTGHLWTGFQGQPIQFRFWNDTGFEALLQPNDFLFVVPCPSWFESASGWSGTAPKYMAIPPRPIPPPAAGAPCVLIQVTGRSGPTYQGTIVAGGDGNTTFYFPGDPGIETLLPANALVLAVRYPSQLGEYVAACSPTAMYS